MTAAFNQNQVPNEIPEEDSSSESDDGVEQNHSLVNATRRSHNKNRRMTKSLNQAPGFVQADAHHSAGSRVTINEDYEDEDNDKLLISRWFNFNFIKFNKLTN